MEVFISHASEDKDEFVRPLAEALRKKHFSIWYDEYVIKVGDSLRESIDKGLRECEYGIVVFSEYFFAKNWTQKELNGLFSLMMADSKKRILPILHQIPFEKFRQQSPLLSDFYAISSSIGLDAVVRHLIESMNRDEVDGRFIGETKYKHSRYSHNYYNPPEDISHFGYKFEPPYDFDSMSESLRPREILMCFMTNRGVGGWNSACHITCREHSTRRKC